MIRDSGSDSGRFLSDDAPLNPDDESLVAYIDGELDASERYELEERLLQNGSLRQRLNELQQGWDLLDKFSPSSPSEKLVESTMELVVADFAKPHSKSEPVFARYRWFLYASVAGLLGVVIAGIVIFAIRSKQYERELIDLGLAENLDAYYQGQDLQFMRDLSLNESWTKMISTMKEIGDIQPPVSLIANTEITEREVAIERLPLADRAVLDARWKRFMRLDRSKQQQIRETADAVQKTSDPKRLLETMSAYAIWRESLPSDLRDGIESSKIDQSRDALNRAIEETQLKISKQSAAILSAESIEQIEFVLYQILEQRKADAHSQLSRFMSRIEPMVGPDQVERITIAAMVVGNRPGRPDSRNPRLGFLRGTRDRPEPLTNEELAMIQYVLSEDDHQLLDLIAGNPRNPIMETETLRFWAEETVMRNMPFRTNDNRSLLDRYKQIDDPEYREVLDLLPPEEIIDRLTPER